MKHCLRILPFLMLSVAGFTASAQFDGFANKGLVGVARIAAATFDKAGPTNDTLGGFSALWVDPASLAYAAGAISGTLYGLPDRGFGDGTTDYRPRLETYTFAITPYEGPGPAPEGHFVLTNTATRLLTFGGTNHFTGFDAGDTNSPAYPKSPDGSIGGGRRSMDAEGLVPAPGGGWFVSDEYGPAVFRFDAEGDLEYTLLPPEALVPKRGAYPGSNAFTGTNAPASGRRNNRGLEGLSLTPDGRRLVAALQSPTVQDGGGGNLGRLTRVLQFDIDEASPNFGKVLAEHVYPLTLNGTAQTNRHTPVSEILALNHDTFLMLERDSLGLGVGTNTAPSYKRIVVSTTAGATNIAHSAFDLERGAPGARTLPSGQPPADVAAMKRMDLVDLLDASQLARFNLNASTNQDTNTLSEKWEGLGLVPLNDPAFPDDFLLFIGNDNDFKAANVYHNGLLVGTNDVPVDIMILAYRVTLPNHGRPRPANRQPSVALSTPAGDVWAGAAPLVLTAAAYDDDGRIVRVEFLDGATSLGVDDSFPFDWTIPQPAVGSHAFTARVTDDGGLTAEVTRTIEVTAGNVPPAVAITGPSPGGEWVAPAHVALGVSASDSDGLVSRVAYYRDGVPLGSSTAAPFSLTASNFLVGAWTLTAVATDNLGLNTTSAPVAVRVNRATGAPITLQILHASDFEAGTDAVIDAPRFSSVVNGLKAVHPTNTIILAGGDNYIPSPFFTASADPAAQLGGEKGRGDILLANAIGVQASGLGNHEFDDGTARFATLLRANAGVPYPGTLFPYVSANLNFAADTTTAGLVGADGGDAARLTNRVARHVTLTVAGQLIGITGVTTPEFRNITSAGNIGVNTDTLAATQAAIDALLALGCNKILVLAHLQQITHEVDLAQRLREADVVLAAGSNTLLAKPADRLRPGDVRDGDYPLAHQGASGEPVLVVNTEGNFRYVGRLVVTFDGRGVITQVDPASGAYATDEQGVADTGSAPASAGVTEIVGRLGGIIDAKDGVRFGRTLTYLNGLRGSVRSEETNLGDLSADANLLRGRKTDPTVSISIKNGGGIRDAIGTIDDRGSRLPPAGNPRTGKLPGEISQLDIENALRFNNTLTLLTLTAQQLRDTVEWGVAATTPTSTPGQFPQVGGLLFSYDISRPPMTNVVDANNVPTGIAFPGQRVRTLVAGRGDGSLDLVVEGGVLVGDPNRTFRVVTLNFLANKGDSYFALSQGSDRVDLVPAGTTPGFDTDGGEQKALADYLVALGVVEASDTPISMDRRIQRIGARADDVAAPEITGITWGGAAVDVAVQTLPGKPYTLEGRSGWESPWRAVSATVTGDGLVLPLRDSTPKSTIRFYRVVAP